MDYKYRVTYNYNGSEQSIYGNNLPRITKEAFELFNATHTNSYERRTNFRLWELQPPQEPYYKEIE